MSDFDYQTICKKDTPQKERRLKNIGDIWSNSAKCKRCNEIIRSKNQHDFQTCKCGAISIDGGSWYMKICGNHGDWEAMTESFDDVKEE